MAPTGCGGQAILERVSASSEQISPRDAALRIALRLKSAGFRALFAGGCVRDRLLNIPATDVDVATSATPHQVKELFPNAVGVGEAFGVMLVRCGGHTIEVATFRSDGPYSDGRRPSHVTFSGEREDALRRDFTINGLFEDPETGEVIDYVGGQSDLRASILRAIGGATQRFQEDRLRTLRALRFAARFDLKIESDTLHAIRAFASDLAGVSQERIGNEVRRMLAHASRARAVELCEELGLAPVMLREPAAECALEPLRALPPDARFETALAAWMMGRSISTGVQQRIRGWRNALLLSNDETRDLQQTLHLCSRISEVWPTADVAGRKRLAASPCFAGALQILATTHTGLAQHVHEAMAELQKTGLAPEPFVNGDDLVRAGLAPGPSFGKILEDLYDRQLNGFLTSREQALEAVGNLAKGA